MLESANVRELRVTLPVRVLLNRARLSFGLCIGLEKQLQSVTV